MNRLAELLADAKQDAARRAAAASLESLRDRALARDDHRSFRQALGSGLGQARLIAEIKRASPTRPAINLDLEPAGVARSLERGGAVALSVLTEPRRFRGSMEDLSAARAATSRPVLRKDFVTGPYMVYEAAAGGADCVLLIATALGIPELEACLSAASECGIDVLFEVGDAADLEKAHALGPSIVGVNCRDLGTFELHPDRHEALRDRLPAGCTTVAESGIRTAADRERLCRLRYDGVLVGEAVSGAPDPGEAVRRLLGRIG